MNVSYNNFLKIYSAYQGTSDDLIFWVLIDTLFLTLKKGLSAGNISLLITVSFVATFIFRFPVYKLIKRIGNAASLVVAAFMFLAAACLLTFGNSLLILGLGQSLYALAPLFQDTSELFLKDHLDYFGKKQEFVHTMSMANMVYSTITLIAACVSGKLFDISGYLPMYLCIGFCVNSLVLSIILAKNEAPKKNKPILIPGRRTSAFNGAVNKCIVLLSLNGIMLNVGNANFKLLFQARLEGAYSEETIVLFFSVLIIFTRIAKLLSNAVLRRTKTTDNLNEKILIGLSALLVAAFVLTLIGKFMPAAIGALMAGIGLSAIHISFDPIRTILIYYALSKTTGKNSQLIISALGFIKDAIVAVSSGVVTVILTFSGFYSVVLFFLLIAVLLFVLCLMWRKKIHCVTSAFSYYDLEQSLDKIDSLKISAAFLSRHYGFLKKGKGEWLISKSSQILKLKMQSTYDYNQLKQEYKSGYPCAVEIISNGKNKWLPVIFLDDDDVIMADFAGKQYAFLSECSNVVNMCSFSNNLKIQEER